MANPHPTSKFKPGNRGKPPGTLSKTNRLVKEVVSDVFNHLQTDPSAKTAKADLKSWAIEHPKDFYQIAAKLIPVQMEHTGDLGITWNEQKLYETKPETDKSP